MMSEKQKIPNHWFSLTALGLVLLATWLRWRHLDSIPPGLWFDEGFNAMEAVWMLNTQNWPVFILGGQGREVMFHYFLTLSIAALGQTIYAIRFVPTLLGILTIPLMYRWVLTIFKHQMAPNSFPNSSLGTRLGIPGESHKHWIALISTASLTVSFWFLVMNRVGYRANTLLPFFLLTGYFFWRGRQSDKLQFYVAAGVCLGLCQYTYLGGRLVPLIFITFCLLLSPLWWKSKREQLKRIWLGLFIMGGWHFW